jgi:hypothetical protein
MSLDPAHEALRRQPLSRLGTDLACAVIDHHHGEDAVRVVCALINLASVMSGKLSAVDQMICAVAMHEAAIELHPPKPMMHKNGKRVELVK